MKNGTGKLRKEKLRHQINALEEGISDLIDQEQKDFNPCWGEVMRSGNEESRFATLVERFACIYMACVSNLSHYSAFKYFRPRRRYLAHDPNPFEELEAFHEDEN